MTIEELLEKIEKLEEENKILREELRRLQWILSTQD